jgi:hypothetical protein
MLNFVNYLFLLFCMFCFILLFYVLFVCKCVLYYCHRVFVCKCVLYCCHRVFVCKCALYCCHRVFVCKCVLYYCHRVPAQFQLTNISYINISRVIKFLLLHCLFVNSASQQGYKQGQMPYRSLVWRNKYLHSFNIFICGFHPFIGHKGLRESRGIALLYFWPRY